VFPIKTPTKNANITLRGPTLRYVSPAFNAIRHPLIWRVLGADNVLPAVLMELMAIRDSSGITRLPSSHSMLG